MVAEWVLAKLIEAGRTDDPESLAALQVLDAIRDEDEIDRLHWAEWDAATAGLTTLELVALLKALVVAERAFGWIGGSVAAAIWVFRQLERREPALSREVADWILPRSLNPWVPFGTSRGSARSMAEYEEARAERAARRAVRALKNDELREEARRRREHRAARAVATMVAQQGRAEDRRSALIELSALDPVERLRHVAADTKQSLLYYPAEWAEVDEAALNALDSTARASLIERLKERRKGPWRKLCIRLSAL